MASPPICARKGSPAATACRSGCRTAPRRSSRSSPARARGSPAIPPCTAPSPAARSARCSSGSAPARSSPSPAGAPIARASISISVLAGVASLRAVYTPDSFPRARAECEPRRRSDPDKVAYLAFTSGTTGAPKCVMHSDNTLLANARDMVRDWGHGPDTVLLSLSPLSHHIAWVGVAQWLVAGCRFVTNDPPAGTTRARLDRRDRRHLRHGGADARHGRAGPAEGARARAARARRACSTWPGAPIPPSVAVGVRGAGHQAAEHLRHDRELLAPVHAPGRRYR